jgi:NAD(P)-dependent dehydrogenase (short-subunit alcohol dehydrogenase family)
MGLLDGKVAFITGGARGMGRATALTLARDGADIVVVDLLRQTEAVKHPMAQANDLEETVAAVEALGRRVIARQADVREQEQLDAVVTEAIEKLGHIDILFANAGIFHLAPYWELTEAQWTQMIDIDLSGVWRSAKAVTPHMIERQQGSIV